MPPWIAVSTSLESAESYDSPCIGYLDHPFEKEDLVCSIPLILDTEPDGGTEESVLLAGWREEDSIRQAHRRHSGSTCFRKPSGCRANSLRSEDSGNTMTRWHTSTHS